MFANKDGELIDFLDDHGFGNRDATIVTPNNQMSTLHPLDCQRCRLIGVLRNL